MSWQPLAVALVSSGSRGNKLLFCHHGDLTSNKDTERDLLSKLPRRTLAELLAPCSVMVDRKFELRVDEWKFVGHPFSLHGAVWSASFNVVFVLQANCSLGVVMAYDQLSQLLGAALIHEEHRCGYLKYQVNLLMHIGEDLDEMDTTADKKSLEASSLAQSLFTVLNLLQQGDPHVHVKLNKWSEVNYLLKPLICTGENMWRGSTTTTLVKAYTSLLLLQKSDVIQETLPVSCNPSLHRFLVVLSPVKNLQQVAIDADISLRQAILFAAHLVHWGKAMTVYPLSENSIYITSPSANTVCDSEMFKAFTDQFPSCDPLPVLLSKFSSPVQLAELKDDYPDDLVPIVSWLLQRHQIEQIHTYIYIVKPLSDPLPPQNFSLFPSSRTSFSVGTTEKEETSVINDTSRINKEVYSCLSECLTREELSWILNTEASYNTDDLDLFSKLCQYFHGNHHLEEILMLENMKRSQLLELIDKFSEILVTFSLPEHSPENHR